jgi:hypothetical protein
MEERLIEIFKEYLPAWSWEEWQAAGASDKEDIVINALADLGPDMPIDVDEAYDLFWDWAAGITEADFGSDLQEANRVVRGAANRPWYSGSFRGLNDIDTRVTPEEKARVAAENEARRQRQAELEAERRAAALERRKQMAIKVAEDAIAKGVIDKYNEAHRASILASPNVYPAIDPETKELVFDKAEQRRILDPITQRVNAEKEAKKAAEKEAAKKAAERREAEKPITYYLYPEVVINGETMRSPDGTRVVGQDNLISAAKKVAREELDWVNTERKFYVAGGHPFNWDGVITIICKNPDGTEKPFRTFKVMTNESLEEAVRVISNPDILYHATEAENLYKILKDDTLKGSANTKANLNAVCLTSDKNYTIYKYPCKLQFSRELLEDGGYEFIPYDDFEANPEAPSESEERVLGDITNISKYLTAIYLNWDQISIAKSIQPGHEGNYISGPKYDAQNNEDEVWNLRYEDFIDVLKQAQASGVAIYQEGRKTYRYWIDEDGAPHYGKMPAPTPAAV